MKRSDLKIFPTAWIAFCDAIAALAWTYAVIKIFVGDIDRWALGQISPNVEWLVDHRLIAFLIAGAVLAFAIGRNKFVLLVCYIIFFPVILLLWKVPFILVRIGSWAVGLAFASGLLSLFTNIRYRIVSSAAYLLSITMIVIGWQHTVIVGGLVVLAAAVAVSYSRAFVNAFRAPQVLRLYRRLFRFASEKTVETNEKDAAFRGRQVSEFSGKELETRSNQLQNVVMVNRVSFYFAGRLKEFQRSEYGIITGLISSVSLLVLTAVSFSFIYYGYHKVDPSSLTSPEVLSWFDYFHLSFNNMVFGSVDDIKISSEMSQAISIYQRFLSLLLIGIFVSVLVSVRSKKHETEILMTIEDIASSSRDIERHVLAEYNYATMHDAIADLKKIETAFARFIIRLTNSIDGRSDLDG